MDLLPNYAALLAPGLLLVVTLWLLVRQVQEPLLATGVLIGGFVLMRDAMTPAGLWRIGTAGAVPWLRFDVPSPALVALGVGMLALAGLVLVRAPRLRELVVWGPVTPVTVAVGVVAGAAVAVPVLLIGAAHPVADRGGAVALAALPALAFFALAGNLGEEVLFRGVLQGRLEQSVSRVRAALISAVAFAACHSFLATTVTDVGWPILAFTLAEGLVCAALRARWGVVPAALAHGTAVFLVASGI